MPDFFLNVPDNRGIHRSHRRSSEGCLSTNEFLSARLHAKRREMSPNNENLLDVLKHNYEIVTALADIERAGDESPQTRRRLMRTSPGGRLDSPRPLGVQAAGHHKWRNEESTSVSSNDSIAKDSEPSAMRGPKSKLAWLKQECRWFVDDVVDALETCPNANSNSSQEQEKLSAVQLKKDLKRFYVALHPYIEMLAALYDLIMWKNPVASLLLALVYMYSVVCGWTTALILMLTITQLAINYLSARRNIQLGLVFLPRKEVPSPRLDISGAQLIFDIAKMAQRLLRFAADVLEKLHSLLTWKDERVTRRFFYLLIYWLVLSVVFSTGTCLGMCAVTLGIRIFITTYLFDRFPKLRYRLDTWGYFYRNLPLRSPNTAVRCPERERERLESEERNNSACSTGRRATFAGETFESRLGSNFNLDQSSAVNLLLGNAHGKHPQEPLASPSATSTSDEPATFLDEPLRLYSESDENPRHGSTASLGADFSPRVESDVATPTTSVFSNDDDSSFEDDAILENVIAFRSCVMNEREKMFPKSITSGILYLTDAALIFRSRSLNDQKDPTMMLFHDIVSVKKVQSLRSMSLITGTRKSLEVTIEGRKKSLQFIGIARRDDFVTRVQLMCRNAGATPAFSE